MPVFSTVLRIRSRDGHLFITLRGELDLVDAAAVATALMAAADREPRIVVHLARLDFIDVRAGPGATCCWPRPARR
jgi:anti-anti-sigma factor